MRLRDAPADHASSGAPPPDTTPEEGSFQAANAPAQPVAVERVAQEPEAVEPVAVEPVADEPVAPAGTHLTEPDPLRGAPEPVVVPDEAAAAAASDPAATSDAAANDAAATAAGASEPGPRASEPEGQQHFYGGQAVI